MSSRRRQSEAVGDLMDNFAGSSGNPGEQPEADYGSLSKSERHDYLESICSTSGNLVQLNYLLAAGIDVDKKVGGTSGTGYWLACENDFPKLAEALLNAGADPSIRDEEEKTALMAACQNGSVKGAKYALKNNKDINATDAYGKTALMYAAEGGEAAIVELLTAAGADKTIKDGEDQTALDIAESWAADDDSYNKVVASLN